MGSFSKMKDEFNFLMMNEFEMKDLGPMKFIDCKPPSTPIFHAIKLCRDDGAKKC